METERAIDLARSSVLELSADATAAIERVVLGAPLIAGAERLAADWIEAIENYVGVESRQAALLVTAIGDPYWFAGEDVGEIPGHVRRMLALCGPTVYRVLMSAGPQRGNWRSYDLSSGVDDDGATIVRAEIVRHDSRGIRLEMDPASFLRFLRTTAEFVAEMDRDEMRSVGSEEVESVASALGAAQAELLGGVGADLLEDGRP